jgi:acyl-CoA synthetase (AMP-forming)/AMP-acid ligase II
MLYTHLTFQQLDKLSNAFARGLSAYGVERGMKILLFVKPGLDFYALAYGLFKIGAVPVLIDPGMGRSSFLECIESIAPEGLIGIPKAHIARLLFRRYFRSLRFLVTAGNRKFWGGKLLSEIIHPDSSEFMPVETGSRDLAAIVFTTGSTGVPKGVCYFHEQMRGQVEAIRTEYQINDSDVDFPIFPLFGLFSTAWGITSVIPDMDPTKPAQADPEKIIRGVIDNGVTMSIGSPVMWGKIAAYCAAENISFPSVRRILMVGAPVRHQVLSDFEKILPTGVAYTPYGATEALPIANISGAEILKSTSQQSRQGRGTCVGRPFPGVSFSIMPVTDEQVSNFSDIKMLSSGEIGEVLVAGPMVTREYFENEKATSLAKVYEGEKVWHRMGDVGWLDKDGRLWFCGRKAHRVEALNKTFFSVCCEAIFNNHEKVYRSALVGVTVKGKKLPLIVIELKPEYYGACREHESSFRSEMQDVAKQSPLTADIELVLFHPSFPVDIRHNAKIFREKLAVWAQGIMDRG